jgi:hypothetical protein
MEVIKISNTAQKFNGETYYLCGYYYQRKGRRLHRSVWEHHNGPIPNGYHIHHKDGDRCNNDIENLELVLAEEHLSGHMSSEERKAKSRETVCNAIEAAKQWHKSADGKQWHSKQSKETWKNRSPIKLTCTNCGTEFESLIAYKDGANRFCGNSCRAAYRRKSKVDNETRSCVVCGKQFFVNKYSKQLSCGKECAKVRRWG